MKKSLAILYLFLLTSVVYAQTTVCYKNNWDSPATIEDTVLDGGECKGRYSLKDMKKANWSVADIKIESNQNTLNYRYFLVKNQTSKKKQTKENIVPQKIVDEAILDTRRKFTIKPIGVKLEDIQDNKAAINIGNLLVGQSGIVVHIYKQDKKQIISNAKVISSDENSSVIEFFPFNDLNQPALPISNRKVTQGDILLLNYMYPSSLLIAPTQETFQIVRNSFNYNNFLHTDIFAAKLKINSQPYPTKEDIQQFAIEQNLGTIFIVVNQKVYILDTKTFKILTYYDVTYDTKKSEMPFYTRVEEIEESPLKFNLNIFSDKKNISYKQYYEKLLGIK